MEMLVLVGQLRRQLTQHRHDGGPIFPFDDDDGIVFFTELLDVLVPESAVLVVRVDQVVATRLVAELRRRVRGRQHRQAGR